MIKKHILAVAAMDIEKELLLSSLKDIKETTLANGALLQQGSLNNAFVNLLLCGIGKANAAASCALAIQADPEISLVVNTGVGGGLLDKQKPGDLVIASQAAYHDVDATAFGYAYGQVPKLPTFFVGDSAAQQFLLEKSRELGYQAENGLIVSGDQFIGSAAQTQAILRRFPQAACVEMEAAAIAQTAFCCGKPFVIIRALSDKANASSKQDFAAFAKEAAQRSAQLTRALTDAPAN